ncbi:MAG: hypothetical protein ACE5GE_15810, partial [Phycisphaerae bacterium]
MRQHRIITAAGAGSALAACLALVVTLFVPHSGSTVEAATIFDSFKEAVGNAFDVSFENIGAEGIQVDGRVVIVFDPADAQGTPFESSPQGVFVEAKVRAGDDADDDVAGLDVDATVSAVPNNEWAYVKLTGLPRAVAQEEPVAQIISQIARNGLLLDLDGLLQKEGFGMGAWNLSEHLLDVSGDADADRQTGEQGDGSGLDEEQLERMLVRVLTGKATAQEFRGLVALLEEAATNVDVKETEPGLHVLSARGFDFQGDAEAKELLGDMVLQVAYREGTGLSWVQIDHVGQLDGTIR